LVFMMVKGKQFILFSALCILLTGISLSDPYKPCYAKTSILLDSRFNIIVPFGRTELSSRKFHYGVDLKAVPGEIFYSPVCGVITFKGYTPESTETITICTENNLLVSFLNLTKVKYSKGDRVNYGDPLGVVELNPGASTTTPHVHLSVRDAGGKYLNPALFITFICEFYSEGTNERIPESTEGQVQTPPENRLFYETKTKHNLQSVQPAENAILHEKEDLKSKREFKSDSFLINMREKRVLTSNNLPDKSCLSFPRTTDREGKALNYDGDARFFPKPKIEFQTHQKMVEPDTTNHFKNYNLKFKNLEIKQISCCGKQKFRKQNTLLSKNLFFLIRSTLSVLSLFTLPVIIWRRSLLPARTGGRLSPQGGEYFARI